MKSLQTFLVISENWFYKRKCHLIAVLLNLPFSYLIFLIIVYLLCCVSPIFTQQPNLVVQTGHGGSVESIAFSPDGKTLASGDFGNTIKLWNVERGAEIKTLVGHVGAIRSLAFSPDGKTLASGDISNAIKLWNVESGTEIRTLTGYSGMFNQLAFSIDGKVLAGITTDKKIKLSDVKTGAEIRTLKDDNDSFNSLAFSPNGKFLASGTAGKKIIVWVVKTGEKVKKIEAHTEQVGGIDFSPNSKMLASVSTDETIKLWDVESWTEIKTFKDSSYSLENVKFSLDGRTLASVSVSTTNLWNIESGKNIRTIELGMLSYSNSFAFSPDGKTLARGGALNNAVKLWDYRNGMQIKSLESYTDAVGTIAFSPDSKTLASVSGYFGTIKLWNLKSRTQIKTFKAHREVINSIAFSPNGKSLATASINNTIKLLEIETGAETKILKGTIDNINSINTVNSIAFSSDGKILAGGGLDTKIRIWNIESGAETKKFEGHLSSINSVTFSLDGNTLASASSDGAIKLWNVESGAEIKTLIGDSKKVQSVAFSPDGKTLASAGFAVIRLWNVKTGIQIREIKNQIYTVNSVAFSPDGKTLVSDTFQKIKIWNVESGAQIKSLDGHSGWSLSFAFAPDGKTLVSGSSDGKIKIWDVKTGKEIVTLIALVNEEERKWTLDIMISELNSADQRTYTFDEAGWVVITPDGRFDTNKNLDKFEGITWILPNQPLTPKPLEIFMRQYYEPGLLRRVLQCNEDDSCDREFSPLPSIADINRVQPKVVIKNVKNSGSATDLVDVTVEVENMSEVIKVSRKNEAQTKQLSSGVYDLRLFRDSQLVDISTQKEKLATFIEKAPQLIRETKSLKKLLNTPEDIVWRETTDVFKQNSKNIRILSPTRAEYTFRNIKLPKDGQKETEFTAYAFNSDKVKSEITAPFKFVIPNSIVSAPKKPQAFIISIGVNASQNRAYNLRYAADDAKLTLKTIKSRLEAEREKYSNIMGISLLSNYDKNGNVTEKTAQKAVIKGVFSMLAGKSYSDVVAEVSKENPQARDLFENLPDIKNLVSIEPEDTLIIMFSGHGYSDNAGIFYLLPYDIEENTTLLTPAEQRKTISSDELSLWMQDITAKEMIFIIDACHSSKAVQGGNFKPGPMGSRGLGQLAYDKDMKILSATQDNEAWELAKLKQGLLTYSLIQDGIINSYADKDNNKELTAEEWLSYAETGVPKLYQKEKGGEKGIIIHSVASENTKNRFLQQPSLFNFKRRQNRKQILFKLP